MVLGRLGTYKSRPRTAESVASEALNFISSRVGVDVEAEHARADEYLCELLEFHGHKDVAEAFRRMDKWYA